MSIAACRKRVLSRKKLDRGDSIGGSIGTDANIKTGLVRTSLGRRERNVYIRVTGRLDAGSH